jgi:internalin A
VLDDQKRRPLARRLKEAAQDLVLSLAGFRLGYVPEEITRLRNLEVLDLSNNDLTDVPHFVGHIRSLRYLSLGGNHLHHLPTALRDLCLLQTLNLSSNTDLTLPDWLGEFKELQTLVLRDLKLREVPDFVRTLTKLRNLHLGMNSISALPDWLAELKLLEILRLEDNKLSSLPESLRRVPRLKGLNVMGNPALRLPRELEQSGVAQRILDHYFRTASAAALPLNEFKLILVGRGGVGKTSLVHRLTCDRYKNFKRTPGIKITKWPMVIGGDDVRAHLWDFGGQEILHGTHRFFMTERALYLVLISGREGSEDHDADYWLQMVRSFAGDEVPIIVLLHKWSDYRFELNRKLLREKYGAGLVFIETDSETGEGMQQLRAEISRRAQALPGLKAAWPGEWRRIKEELPAKKKNWVTFDEFRAYCSEQGITAANDQEALAESLHDLGLMLSYQHDESLRHFGVLNPQWVTKGIYEMLNAPSIREEGGKFTLAAFGEILPEKQYPAKLHPYLLALMRRFGLCHPLDEKGTRYLIPELLSKEEKSLETDFPPEHALGFIYRYDAVLPEGLLPRFIVETYVHREPRLAWRTGVVLEREDCRALIRGDVQGRTVDIRVVGGSAGARRSLLAIVREHFERIHRTYEKLPVTELVPVAGLGAPAIEYEFLRAHERDGRETVVVPAGSTLRDLNVKDLLDGVDLPGVRRNGFAVRDTALDVFISYAHKDAALLDQLRGALVPYERLGRLRIWADPLLETGETWDGQIVERLERARVVILLLTQNFMRSAACMEDELPRAIERHARGEATIFPIVARECRHDLGLGTIQVILPFGKPVDQTRNRSKAWVEVTRQLDRVLEGLAPAT